jgi:hypothetical protein
MERRATCRLFSKDDCELGEGDAPRLWVRSSVNITIGPLSVDHADYDADDDVL